MYNPGYVSPYIEESLEQPVSKIYRAPADVIHDSRLTLDEKALLLRRMRMAGDAPLAVPGDILRKK